MKTFLMSVFALGLSVAAIAQAPVMRDSVRPFDETISVTGTGHATVTPDRFSFTVGVQTISDTVEQAVNENNSKTAATIAASELPIPRETRRFTRLLSLVLKGCGRVFS